MNHTKNKEVPTMMTISTAHEHGSNKVYYRVENRKDWKEAYQLIRYKANV